MQTTTTREFFTNGQLTLIASAAAVCAEPFEGATMSDEMAVYDMIANYAQGFTSEQLAVLEFCAHECEVEKSGAKSVYCMVNAWNHAMDCQHAGQQLDQDLLRKLDEMVEPDLADKIICNWLTGTLNAPQFRTEL